MEAEQPRQGAEKPSSDGFRTRLRRAGTFLRARRLFLIGAGLVLLTIGVYFPALDSLMVADDFRIVGQLGFEDAVRSLHDTVGYGRNEYRPAIAFSYAVSNWLWDGDLRGYHLESILFHAINVTLLFAGLLLVTRSAAVSGMAAAVFAVHPIHDSRVVWIAARDSLLSTLFTFLALIAYARARVGRAGSAEPSAASARVLIGLSTGFFALSLVCYEGAAVVPAIMAGMELFLFAQPSQGLLSRMRTASAKTLPHTITLLVYLAWWALLFRGNVGQYELSYAAGNVLRNYYSLFYQLFHGNAHLAGLLYFMLLVLAFLLPRQHRPLAGFSILFMLIAFLPFVIIEGFARRFAYASAAGYAALIALLIYACAIRKPAAARSAIRFISRPLAALIFIVLAGYYAVDLRARISDWKTAGEIADSIPRQIKALYPDLPDGSKLVLARIPHTYGHAYVYPLGLRSSVARFYPGRNLQVIYGPGDLKAVVEYAELEGPDIYYFNYFPGKQGIEEVVDFQK